MTVLHTENGLIEPQMKESDEYVIYEYFISIKIISKFDKLLSI